MKIISWNYWELENSKTIRELYRLVREKRPEVIFLMETEGSDRLLNSVKMKLGFDNMFVVNSLDRKRGLAMLWKTENGTEIMNYSNNHIHLRTQDHNPTIQWYLTGIYGHPKTTKRTETWSLLSWIQEESSAPWCVIGDFNKIRYQNEKEGGRLRPEKQMKDFRDTLQSNNLFDIG